MSQFTMELFIDGDGWMCRDDDPATLDLFGTDTLPLPFLANASPESVSNVIKELNPDKKVVILWNEGEEK